MVAGDIVDLEAGLYRYVPVVHELETVLYGDLREELAAVALGQQSVRDGAVIFVFSGVYERTTGRYGDRGEKYVHIEVGHAAQNLCLQVMALEPGGVVVCAFSDDGVRDLLAMPEEEAPVYVIPVGRVSPAS